MKPPTSTNVSVPPKRDELNSTLALDLESPKGSSKEAKESKPKLQVANGYSVNFDQLAQLLHTVSQDNRKKIPRSELANTVGLAHRQMEYLTSIAVALGLIYPITLCLTPTGKVVLNQDQFFDDIGTLWFLHYIVGSNPNVLVWNRFVNNFLPAHTQFNSENVRASYTDLSLNYSKYSMRAHIAGEVRTILDAYTNQQFSKLAYLRKSDDMYSLGYRQPVPIPVLAASITRFRDQHQTGNTAVSVRDLISAPNSPGIVFQMHEDTLRAGLEQLRHGHGFSLEARADLDQLRFAQDIPDYVRMERYYGSR